ncbi:zinc-ribbon domain-containing protein [Ruminococcaceae bacterium FB2012]|nr:zinc-ribbon domain-containing protein [Ruminococcaceae bacterium FB2012]
MSTAKNKVKPKKSGFSRLLTLVLAAVVAISAAVSGYCAYDLFGRGVEASKAVAASEKADEEAEENPLEKEFRIIEQAAKEEAERLEKEAQNTQTPVKKNYSPAMIDVVSVGSGFDDGDEQPVTTVTDQNSAKEMLNTLAPELGIKDAAQEYSLTDVIEQGDYSYYVMKQNFNGIEVIGADLIMQASKQDGTLVNVGGNYEPVPEDLDTETTLSYEEITKIVRTYSITNQPVVPDELNIDIRGQKILPIKPTGYASCFEVVCSDLSGMEYTVAVEGKTGKILTVTSPIVYDMIYKGIDSSTGADERLTGQSDKQALYIWKENDDLYYFKDTDRNVSIRLNDRNRDYVTYTDLNSIDVHYYNLTDEDGRKRTPDPSSVDALANIQRTYDFYKTFFSREGINPGTELKIYVGITNIGDGNNSYNLHNNAAMFGDKFIVIGTNDSNEFSARTEVVGHEFTHGVIASYKSGLNSLGHGNEQDTINEGFADVFGELIEDYSNDGQLNLNADWVHGSRNFITPAVDNYSGIDPASEECHRASTLISGPFYKMVKASNNAVPETTFANLYYETIPALTASTSIPMLRSLVENSALKMNYDGTASNAKENRTLTDGNMEVIIDAFDAFGIESAASARVVKGGKLRVFDKDIKLYGNYNIKLYRPFDTQMSAALFDQNVTEAGGFDLPESINPGYYVMVVTDLANTRNSEKMQILINDNSADQKVKEYPAVLNIFTKFNSEAKDVVLVLDSSGSMEGSPIQQARTSAKNFVTTVLKTNPSASISLISYNSGVDTRVTASSNKSKLISSIDRIYDSGRTNIYDALDAAKKILEKSDSKKKLVVLLSDGLPNEGPSDGGDYYAPIYRLTDEMKGEGIIVYSLGFFHNLTGSELSSGQKMMSQIATEGYDYVVDSADEVSGVVSELELVFNDFAEMFNGKRFINIRIACPVDVNVTYNGETLSSDPKNPSTRTSFGTLSYEKVIDEETGEESEDTVKVLRLDESADYEICINGTGKGKMDYTISYPDEEGEYTDVREFKRVPITKDTVMAASTKQEDKVGLKVDSDGDGTFDLNYEAVKNKSAEQTSGDSALKIILIISTSVAGAGILAYLIIMLMRRVKAAKAAAVPAVCANCGAPLAENAKFCRNCGTAVPVSEAPAPEQPVKASKAPIIVKLAFICVFTVFTVIVTNYYYSPATTVFKQLRDGQAASAKLIYDNSGTKSDGYISWLTNHYLGKAETAYSEGKLTEADYRTLLEGVKAVGVDDASDNAKEQLKELDKSSKDGSGSKDESAASAEAETSSAEA